MLTFTLFFKIGIAHGIETVIGTEIGIVIVNATVIKTVNAIEIATVIGNVMFVPVEIVI